MGTGLGSGAVLEGKLYTGFNYAAFESGHMVIRRGGRPCTCGRKGCWEAYASATGLIKSTREAMEAHHDSALWQLASTLEEVNGKTPFDAAQAGDTVAREVLAEYIEDLACGLANLINILQPEVLCVGGGICKQGENLMAPLRDALNREEFTKTPPIGVRWWSPSWATTPVLLEGPCCPCTAEDNAERDTQTVAWASGA